jgi:NADH-quinone oxidoreductase subunit G
MAARLAERVGAVKEGWSGFSILHSAAARVGALDLGFVPGQGGQTAREMADGGVDVLFNLGADEIEIAPGVFVIYQGTHGDRGAHRADVILPGAAYTEKSGTYVNTEGRVQLANRAAFAPGDAREDWAILRALSDVLGHRLPFDSLAALRHRLFAEYPHLAALDEVAPGDTVSAVRALGRSEGQAQREPFISPIGDFYLTNPIARASGVMAECSALARGAKLEAAE